MGSCFSKNEAKTSAAAAPAATAPAADDDDLTAQRAPDADKRQGTQPGGGYQDQNRGFAIPKGYTRFKEGAEQS